MKLDNYIQLVKPYKHRFVLPEHILKNMFNYLDLMKLNYNYLNENGILNIYINPNSVVSFYTTKNFANHYFRSRVCVSISKWENVLRFISMLKHTGDK